MLNSWLSNSLVSSEVGMYKRKFLGKRESKHAFDQEKSKVRKQDVNKELHQEKKV